MIQFMYLGQSGFLVVINGKKILFDPFITGNPLASKLDPQDIDADYIFVSHGHGDHIADVANIAIRTGATVVASPEVLDYLTKHGVQHPHPLNHGGPVNFEFGQVRAVNAIHSSGLPDGSYGGNPLGFVVTSTDGNFYFAGDTALTYDMKLIPLWTKLDFAVLPIGGNYTMDYNDAVLASDFVEAGKVVGVHYNTFDLIAIDTAAAQRAFLDAGKLLLLPAVGETITL